MIIVQQAEGNYWLSQCNKCNKLTTVFEKDKWKLINELTNQQVSDSDAVQPIQILRQGKPVYLFEDSEIRSELKIFIFVKFHNLELRNRIRVMIRVTEVSA